MAAESYRAGKIKGGLSDDNQQPDFHKYMASHVPVEVALGTTCKVAYRAQE